MRPIIEQQTLRVDYTHSGEILVAMGRDIEPDVLSTSVKAYADDRIMVCRRSTITSRRTE